MEYVVRYSPQYDKKYPIKQRKDKRRISKVLLVILVLVTGTICVCKRSESQQWLSLTEAKSVKPIISAFVEDVQSGKSFKDAATSFCLEILDNAQIEFDDPV